MNDPKYRTTLGWTHSCSNAISRRMSSRPSSSSPVSGITFTATIVPEGRCRALYTLPNEPLPSCSKSSKSSSGRPSMASRN